MEVEPLTAQGVNPHFLMNPWFLTSARMDTILCIYFGFKPHDPDVASCPFIQYFASISGYANGLLVGVVVKELIIYARAASEEEVLRMIECIDNPESFGEGVTGLPVHSEEKLNVYLHVKIIS
ncbi:hypothetical protein J4E91_007093 [Alternaria rosae]|nr:hypothetical protein J4E91_007093 [Alternaria rosae]